MLNDDDHDVSGASDHRSSASPSRDVDNSEIQVDYGFEYDFFTPPNTSSSHEPAKSDAQSEKPLRSQIPEQSLDPKDPHHEDEDAETTYQFRLFTSHPSSELSKSNNAAPVRDTIRLSATPPPSATNLNMTDSISLENTQFVRPRRPDSYYFTSALPASTLSSLSLQYSDTALSTTDILARAKTTQWPGTSLPWRVIHVKLAKPAPALPPSRLPSSSRLSSRPTSTSSRSHHNPRPSKKRRLVLRRRSAAQVDLAEKAKAADEADREKRTRRNREKKVKRKEREKRKKQDAAGSLGSDPIGESAVEATEHEENDLGD